MAAFRRRRAFRGRARARPALSWLSREIFAGDVGNPNLGSIQAGNPEIAKAVTMLTTIDRDIVLKAHYLMGSVHGAITAGTTSAAAGTTVELCIGLGIGENEDAVDGLFSDTLMANGGPFGSLGKRGNRYFLICCVSIPIGNWLADNAQDLVTSWATDKGHHTIWVNRNRTNFNWSFWCHAKSARRLQGSVAPLPFYALAARIDRAADMNDTSITIVNRRASLRTVAMFPRGA